MLFALRLLGRHLASERINIWQLDEVAASYVVSRQRRPAVQALPSTLFP